MNLIKIQENSIIFRDSVGYNQEIGSTSPEIKDDFKGFLSGEPYMRSYFGKVNYIFWDKNIVGISLRLAVHQYFQEMTYKEILLLFQVAGYSQMSISLGENVLRGEQIINLYPGESREIVLKK